MAPMAKMDGYRLFRKDRHGRLGRSVALSTSAQMECMELHLGMDEEVTRSSGLNGWVKIKWRTGRGDNIEGLLCVV